MVEVVLNVVEVVLNVLRGCAERASRLFEVVLNVLEDVLNVLVGCAEGGGDCSEGGGDCSEGGFRSSRLFGQTPRAVVCVTCCWYTYGQAVFKTRKVASMPYRALPAASR